MVWTARIHRNSTDMLNGLDGYFGVGGFEIGTPVLPLLTQATPTQVTFTPGGQNNSATVPFFLSQITFQGTGLVVQQTNLPNALTPFPVFTAGTITGFQYRVNPQLDALVQALAVGVSDARRREIEDRLIPAVNNARELVPSATVDVGAISAAELSQAVVAGYTQRSNAPLEAYLDQFNHNYTFDPIAGSGIGNTLLSGYNNADVLVGGPSFDNLFGGGGNDTLIGGAGSDGLNGGAGSDLFLPGPGADVVSDDGTNPNDRDVVSYQNATAAVIIDLNFLDGDQSAGDAQGDQLAGIEVAIGSNFDDVIHGSATPAMENDTLIGGAGDDTLIGYDGSDRLQGGPGFDLLIGGGNNGALTQGPGDVAVFAANPNQINVFNGPNGSLLIAAPGGGVDTIFGIEFLDLNGTFIPVSQLGRTDPSRLRFGDAQNNFLDGTGADDLIFGRTGNDRLRGFDGQDRINGGDGADTLDGGNGNDVLVGGDTEVDLRDVLFGGAGNDFLDGGFGNDQLNGGEGDDTLQGGFGADTVIGNEGNDTLTGAAFGDLMFGGDGRDFINGGFGADRINGGAGGDRFFHLGIADHGSDWIQDYDAAAGDRLVYGGTATRDQFQINTANTVGAGAAGTSESFIIYRPTGQILWALVDGDGQQQINLQLGGDIFNLSV